MFAGFLLLLYASAHKTLCANISAQILYDICNSSLCAINYLRRSLRMTSLCLACAVGRPHFHYSKGSFSFCSIDYSLLWNHSPSEWFSLYKKTAPHTVQGCLWCAISGRPQPPFQPILSSQSGTTGTRALKAVHWTVFARRYAGRRALTGCGARIGQSPLVRGSTSATAAPAPAPCFRRWRRSPPQLFSSPMAHQVLLSRKLNIRKKPCFPARLLFGAPSPSKNEPSTSSKDTGRPPSW